MTNGEKTIANLKKLKSFHNGSYGTDIDRAIKALEQEPKTGHWKYFQNEKGDWMNVCSNCNSDCGVGYPYNYCPNCGCRMESNTKRKGNPIEGNNESYNCENWIP